MMQLRMRIKNKFGLHGRPAGRLVQEAQKYTSAIHIKYNQKTADAKSILEVLMLTATYGSTIEILAQGEDANMALHSIAQVAEEHF